MRPPLPSMVLSRRMKIVLSAVAALIVAIIVAIKLSGIYINFLWYGSLGHRGVYSTIFWTRVSLFFSFGVLMMLIIGGNLVAAYLLKPPFRPMSAEQQNLQHYVAVVEPRRKWILAAVCVITLLAAGASAQGDWKQWQLWLNGGSFGVKDPQFHRDISFYAFDYPVYRILLGFGFTAIIFSLILSVAVHYLTGAIRLQTPGPKITMSARRHLTILVFVFMALKAVAYWLDRYGLVFSSRSKFTGASYTDVHAELPAKTILFWIAIILAVAVLASIWLKSILIPGIGFVSLLVLSILIGGIYPAILQSTSVNPNASVKERPYIARNITATRQAYNIVTRDAKDPTAPVQYSSYQASSSPDPNAVTDQNTTVDNIRILDPNVISPTFTAAQAIGQPYAFAPDLSVDRYDVAGQTHDYIVGVRELAQGLGLNSGQQNWINQHTVYTHGYGFVAAEADDDVTNGGKNSYTEGDIPPTGVLNNTVPQVYFGDGLPNYSIVGAQGKAREYNANRQYITYKGGGGVSLSNLFTRLAFAVKYKETNFVLNDTVSANGAHIIFNRDPRAMVQKVAPFLTVDGNPYPVVDQSNGHIVWMLDGYTTMANYPYSDRQSLSALTGTSQQNDQRNTQINYIRNSVKATVDAFTGKVTLYDWDPSDPLLKAWMKVFPGLVQPAATMPADIRSHVRYPEDLFNVQRALLAQYHINDATQAYNGTGLWGVPTDPNATAGQQPSYYVLAAPPGTSSNEPEFQLTTPMVVNNKTNLAAYISADSDPGPAGSNTPGGDYGKLTVLTLPSNVTVQGPSIVAADFKSNSKISSDITLLGSGQSNVIHGNLLTLPVGNSFLYVEPLYVQATGGFPTLQRVLAWYGGKIGYGTNLADALADIQTGRATGSSITTLGQTTGTGGTRTAPPSGGASSAPPASTSAPPSSTSTSPSTSTPTPGTGRTTPPSVTQLRQQLSTALNELTAVQKTGDLVKIAQAQQKVNQLAQQLLGATAPSTTPRASPSGGASPSR